MTLPRIMAAARIGRKKHRDSAIALDGRCRDVAVLANRTPVCLRPVRAGDREALMRGFERLSADSRYRRFFIHKKGLSDDELDFFTVLDGTNHDAVAAFELRDGGVEGGMIGVARFVRVATAATEAEVAVTVVDEFQNQGLGRLMLGRLVECALDVGIRTLRFHFQADNTAMRRFIQKVWPDAAFLVEHGLATARFSIAHVLQPVGHEFGPEKRP